MTPAHTDSPLRRSDVGVFRDSAQNVTINDDDAERREARRRTILANTSEATSTFEDNETLKKCLEIYNGNKLSRENAWSLSLIDTVSTLLDRHHKSLNNFKIAGSTLEASSKVYGLRVDSIHTDVLRMSAGLNAQKFTDRNLEEDDDDVATGGEGGADPNSSAGGAAAPEEAHKKATKPKRQRKAVSTVTKNKDTLNGRLDTVPLQDPVFGKLNSIVGSINSSNRLMNNILPTNDSELLLRTTFRFWDARTLPECDYTAEMPLMDEATPDTELAACDRLFKLQRYDELQLRPLHSGYVISDTPEAIADDKEPPQRMSIDSQFGGDGGGGDDFHCGGNAHELSMAFDINAECEPDPMLSEQPPPVVEVDFADFDDLTTEERTAINNCRGLRKPRLHIEDLRPVDATSELEYSYRPLDKISQFWAGPSHWKFKRAPRASTLAQQDDNNPAGSRAVNQRARRAQNQQAKKRSKQLNFGEFHDELFVRLDAKCKLRKANVQKKWDQRKLKLPTDLQLDQNMFDRFKFAPRIPVEPQGEELQNIETEAHDLHHDGDNTSLPSENPFDAHFADDPECGNYMNVSSNPSGPNDDGLAGHTSNVMGDLLAGDGGGELGDESDNGGNNTVLEIATDYEGAPTQVTKIIVPFAKRAKVIDMKNLKRCCTQLLTKQMKRSIQETEIPAHPIPKEEHYSHGMASFKEIYNHLPELLTQNMAEALTPSVAFYSVLHLANDYNLRLIPQEDLEDFKIRQITD